MNKLWALIKNDWKNIRREPMMILIFLLPLVLALASRFLLPILADFLLSQLAFDLQKYYPLIGGFFLMFSPMMLGTVAGFLLLDERDDHVMTFLMVTPLAKTAYIGYRVLIPMSIGLVFALIITPLTHLVQISFWKLILIALIVGLETPLITLFMLNFAGNKVEGLTLTKGLGIFMMAPIAGYFLKSQWKLLAGIIPFYWPVQAFIYAVQGDGGYWFHVSSGFLIHLIWLWIFVRLFEKKIQ